MENIEKLLDIMARLRDPASGCPWDREQSFATVAPYTVEEAYEVADAIAREDMAALREELGDLLFQVVFHAQMAAEVDAFDFDGVVEAISGKMLKRHPHVFGSAEERQRGPLPGSWERIKVAEKGGGKSVLDGVAKALPALKRAEKLGKRAGHIGFDWPNREGARQKIDEELAELDEAIDGQRTATIEEELGDLLFAVVNLARHLKVDPEQALIRANRKFEARFRRLEAWAAESGAALEDLDIDTLEAKWQAIKHEVPA